MRARTIVIEMGLVNARNAHPTPRALHLHPLALFCRNCLLERVDAGHAGGAAFATDGFVLQKSCAIPSLASGANVLGGTPSGIGFVLQKTPAASWVAASATEGWTATPAIGFVLQNSRMARRRRVTTRCS
jgi:hypothetical protein